METGRIKIARRAYFYTTAGACLLPLPEKAQGNIASANKGGGLFGKIAKGSASGKNRASLFCYDYATGILNGALHKHH